MTTDALDRLTVMPQGQKAKTKKTTVLPVEQPVWPSVVIGRLVRLENNLAFVQFPNGPNADGIEALVATRLTAQNVGGQVVLAFVNGNPKQPVILNVLLDADSQKSQTAPYTMEIDGEQLVISAQKQVVLRCGEASITLTAAGKVLIKGTYVLSRSSGYNKIKGAAIDIN